MFRLRLRGDNDESNDFLVESREHLPTGVLRIFDQESFSEHQTKLLLYDLPGLHADAIKPSVKKTAMARMLEFYANSDTPIKRSGTIEMYRLACFYEADEWLASMLNNSTLLMFNNHCYEFIDMLTNPLRSVEFCIQLAMPFIVRLLVKDMSDELVDWILRPDLVEARKKRIAHLKQVVNRQPWIDRDIKWLQLLNEMRPDAQPSQHVERGDFFFDKEPAYSSRDARLFVYYWFMHYNTRHFFWPLSRTDIFAPVEVEVLPESAVTEDGRYQIYLSKHCFAMEDGRNPVQQGEHVKMMLLHAMCGVRERLCAPDASREEIEQRVVNFFALHYPNALPLLPPPVYDESVEVKRIILKCPFCGHENYTSWKKERLCIECVRRCYQRVSNYAVYNNIKRNRQFKLGIAFQYKNREPRAMLVLDASDYYSTHKQGMLTTVFVGEKYAVVRVHGWNGKKTYRYDSDDTIRAWVYDLMDGGKLMRVPDWVNVELHKKYALQKFAVVEEAITFADANDSFFLLKYEHNPPYNMFVLTDTEYTPLRSFDMCNEWIMIRLIGNEVVTHANNVVNVYTLGDGALTRVNCWEDVDRSFVCENVFLTKKGALLVADDKAMWRGRDAQPPNGGPAAKPFEFLCLGKFPNYQLCTHVDYYDTQGRHMKIEFEDRVDETTTSPAKIIRQCKYAHRPLYDKCDVKREGIMVYERTDATRLYEKTSIDNVETLGDASIYFNECNFHAERLTTHGVQRVNVSSEREAYGPGPHCHVVEMFNADSQTLLLTIVDVDVYQPFEEENRVNWPRWARHLQKIELPLC